MSALTIYVAGASADREAIAGYMAQLRAAGWHVTYDWPAEPEAMRGSHEAAMADVSGVARARVFWYVAPEAKSEGSHFELGLAWMARELSARAERRIYASGPVDHLGRVFPTLADVIFSHHADALECLIDEAQNAQADTPRAYSPFPSEPG